MIQNKKSLSVLGNLIKDQYEHCSNKEIKEFIFIYKKKKKYSDKKILRFLENLMIAYVRHKYTDYDKFFIRYDKDRKEIRRQYNKEALMIVNTWKTKTIEKEKNKMAKKILIVVDMQKDFIDGSLGSPQAQAIVVNVAKKIREYSKNNDYIYRTFDTHDKQYLLTQEGRNLPIKHCIIDTDGHNMYKSLEDICYMEDVYKHSFGFIEWDKKFGSYNLGAADEIELIGLCTDICVVSNALILKAQFPEVKITVDASCCAGITDESHKAALLVMKMCQVNIINE